MFTFYLSVSQVLFFPQYPLLAAMLTSRPFDEVVERSQSRSLDASTVSSGGGDEAVIRGYAQRYIREIVQMLNIVPRQMVSS